MARLQPPWEGALPCAPSILALPSPTPVSPHSDSGTGGAVPGSAPWGRGGARGLLMVMLLHPESSRPSQGAQSLQLRKPPQRQPRTATWGRPGPLTFSPSASPAQGVEVGAVWSDRLCAVTCEQPAPGRCLRTACDGWFLSAHLQPLWELEISCVQKFSFIFFILSQNLSPRTFIFF